MYLVYIYDAKEKLVLVWPGLVYFVCRYFQWHSISMMALLLTAPGPVNVTHI